MRKLVYDITLGKPGCVILQAALGADPIDLDFPAESWLTYPTEYMRVYNLTDAQYEQAKKLTELVMGGMLVEAAINQAINPPENILCCIN